MASPNKKSGDRAKFDGMEKSPSDQEKLLGDRPGLNHLSVTQMENLLKVLRKEWNAKQKK